ncbi:MAG: hypothetical protein KAV87_33225 [Desulfobacteraceae bacterium]|nr:hypothetical protein [Pseudomonadota bacterium]MCK4788652.1 hypothetical protein [Desulfobacteraceae bacterium]
MIKSFLMVIASVVIFVLLASMDEYESVIAPLLTRETKELKKPMITIPEMDKEIVTFLNDFHSMLSQIYMSADSAKVNDLPADKKILRELVEEIDFLAANGKVMDISIGNIRVKKVDRLSSFIVRVKTMETVSLSYLNIADRTEIVPMQVAEHEMSYLLGGGSGGWMLISLETLGVDSKKNIN